MARLRIYTDENVDVRVADGLRRRGVDARSARDEHRLGATDEQQLAHAQRIGAVLFTHDPDLVKLALEKTHRGATHSGVIFADLHRFGIGECIKRLALYAEVLGAEEMMNRVEFL